MFTSGCNLRCPYCHNPELVTGTGPDEPFTATEILTFLERRRNVLTGVCITGGEPLIHHWLPDLSARIHELGLSVKLDTNGLLPDRILPVRADYIAMDLKTNPARYSIVGGSDQETAFDGHPVRSRVEESIRIIRQSGSAYEFRTTVLDTFVTAEDVRAIAALLEPGERYTLAAFHPGLTLDPALRDAAPPTSETLEALAGIARGRGLDVRVREHRV